MKNLLFTFLTAIILLVFNSCTHYYYAPNAHNVPLFREERQARFTIAGSSGDEFEGIELQSAFSFTKHFGMMANGFFVRPDDGNKWGKGKLVEIGAGYFTSLNKYFVFETFGGFCWGEAINQYEPGFSSSIKFRRYFIQPDIGFITPWIDVAISARFCGLYYNDIDHNIHSLRYEIDHITYIEKNRFSYLFEPALTFRAGWKFIKIQLQLGLSHNLNNPDLQQEILNANIGLYFSLSEKYQRPVNH